MGIVNKAGLTPLTLSCHLGRATIFREMLELTAKEFWRYSNITCSAYPLNALDTILPDGRCSKHEILKRLERSQQSVNVVACCRLELCSYDHPERNERGTSGHAGRRDHPAIAGRKMEDIR